MTLESPRRFTTEGIDKVFGNRAIWTRTDSFRLVIAMLSSLQTKVVPIVNQF